MLALFFGRSLAITNISSNGVYQGYFSYYDSISITNNKYESWDIYFMASNVYSTINVQNGIYSRIAYNHIPPSNYVYFSDKIGKNTQLSITLGNSSATYFVLWVLPEKTCSSAFAVTSSASELNFEATSPLSSGECIFFPFYAGDSIQPNTYFSSFTTLGSIELEAPHLSRMDVFTHSEADTRNSDGNEFKYKFYRPFFIRYPNYQTLSSKFTLELKFTNNLKFSTYFNECSIKSFKSTSGYVPRLSGKLYCMTESEISRIRVNFWIIIGVACAGGIIILIGIVSVIIFLRKRKNQPETTNVGDISRELNPGEFVDANDAIPPVEYLAV